MRELDRAFAVLDDDLEAHPINLTPPFPGAPVVLSQVDLSRVLQAAGRIARIAEAFA